MQQRESEIYTRLETVFSLLADEQKKNYSSEELARAAKIEPGTLETLFEEWAGMDPDTFLRSASHQIRNGGSRRSPDLIDSPREKRTANTTRCFDNRFYITKVEPGGQSADGKHQGISYSMQHTRFGRMMAASTEKGICRVAFLSDESEGCDTLRSEFPKAEIKQSEKQEHMQMANYFCTGRLSDEDSDKLNLHLKGTEFQISVWEALLQIPEGELVCCADIAKEIGNPKALRAVGSAVGSSPVAYFIPCHRVIPAAGGFGNYRWGKARKVAMIGWEVQGGANSSYLSPR